MFEVIFLVSSIVFVAAQIQACERLLKYADDEEEIDVSKEEIFKLRLALDLIRY